MIVLYSAQVILCQCAVERVIAHYQVRACAVGELMAATAVLALLLEGCIQMHFSPEEGIH